MPRSRRVFLKEIMHCAVWPIWPFPCKNIPTPGIIKVTILLESSLKNIYICILKSVVIIFAIVEKKISEEIPQNVISNPKFCPLEMI